MKRTVALSRADWLKLEKLLQQGVDIVSGAPDYDNKKIPDGQAKNALKIGNYVAVIEDESL